MYDDKVGWFWPDIYLGTSTIRISKCIKLQYKLRTHTPETILYIYNWSIL